jgi:hypothetical protein
MLELLDGMGELGRKIRESVEPQMQPLPPLPDMPPQVDGSAENDRADPAANECRDIPGFEGALQLALPSQASIAATHLRKRAARSSTL